MSENKQAPGMTVDIVAAAEKENAERKKALANLMEGVIDEFFTNGGKFLVKKDGVYFAKFDENGGYVSDRKISDYCEVVGNFSNEDGANFGRIIEFTDRRNCKRTKYLKDSVLSGNDTATTGELRDNGLEISPRGQYQSGKIKDYLLIAGKLKPWFNVSTRLGWKETKEGFCYCLPNRVIGTEKQNEIFLSDSVNMDGMKVKGTLEEWQKNIAAPALTSNYLMFSIAAAFAPPLLDMTADYVDSGFFELVGDSSCGKTFALKFAQSVTGYRKKAFSWNMTKNASSMFAYAHNDNLLILDELGSIPKVADLMNMAYYLANGTSKGVGTTEQKTRAQNTWQLFGLTSGEVTLRQALGESGLKAKAGQYLRLVPLTVKENNLFDRAALSEFGFSSKNAFFESMAGKFSAAYGAAFEEWIKMLVALRNDFRRGNEEQELRNDLIKEIRRFISLATEDRPINDQVERVLKRFGLIATAIELASGGLSQYLDNAQNLTGWNKGAGFDAVLYCAKLWLKDYGNLNLNQEDVEIIERASNILQTKMGLFMDVDGNKNGYIPNPLLGYLKDNDGFFYVLPGPFKTEFCKGAPVLKVDKILADAGMLLRYFDEKEGKFKANTTIRVPCLGKTMKLRKMKLTIEVEE